MIKQLSSVFTFLLTSDLDKRNSRNEPEKISRVPEPHPHINHYRPMIVSQRLPAGGNFPRNFALALFRIRNKLYFTFIMFEMTLH